MNKEIWILWTLISHRKMPKNYEQIVKEIFVNKIIRKPFLLFMWNELFHFSEGIEICSVFSYNFEILESNVESCYENVCKIRKFCSNKKNRYVRKFWKKSCGLQTNNELISNGKEKFC